MGGLRFYLRATAWLGVFFLLVATATSCGYHRVRQGMNLPADVRKVAIPVFRNDTVEAGVEVLVTDALREQFVRSGFVRLTDVEAADAVVVGTIQKFSVKAISFAQGDFAVEYRATIRMKIKLVAHSGEVLWEDRNVSRYDTYRVATDIFDSEAARSQAIERMVRDLTADVHDRIFDGFEVDATFPAS